MAIKAVNFDKNKRYMTFNEFLQIGKSMQFYSLMILVIINVYLPFGSNKEKYFSFNIYNYFGLPD